MTVLTMTGSPLSALSHLAALGLVSILRDNADPTARTWWDVSEAQAKIQTSLEPQALGEAIRQHAAQRDQTWIQAKISRHARRGMSLFSPRLRDASDDEDRHDTALERQEWLEANRDLLSPIDQAMLGALGQPAWWRTFGKEHRPDEGASRWEMKTRNSGGDFLTVRFDKVRSEVGQRNSAVIVDGLCGVSVRDLPKVTAESRTATGLQRPGLVDAAIAYVALFGISAFPTVAQMNSVAASAGCIPQGVTHPQWVTIPIFAHPVSPRRFTSVLTSDMFHRAVSWATGAGSFAAPFPELRSQGVHAVLVCPVVVSRNSKAPERYIRSGDIWIV